MRKLLKQSVSFFLVPLTRWYLRKERTYRHSTISVSVWPGVFHPGLFSSTQFVLKFLQDKSLKNATLLELGCGTGLISMVAAREGAVVTACDLSATALKNAKKNFEENNLATIKLFHSDLFDAIEKQKFDWVIINPPYYAKVIQNEEQLAWHCGENFQYFEKLFSTLQEYIHAQSQVIMVLTRGCELDTIFAIAHRHHFHFELLKEKAVLLDGKDFLYRIHTVSSSA